MAASTKPQPPAEPARPAIALALGDAERAEVDAELIAAGFETVVLAPGGSIAEAYSPSRSNLIAVIDVAGDPAGATGRVAEARRGRVGHLWALYLVAADELDGLEAAGLDEADEVVLRPLGVDALRWRIEAMAIRAQVPTGHASDAVLAGGPVDAQWAPSAPVFAVFNPKGGVGKTTVATNLAAVLRARRAMNVLLLDADTVTGHVGLSLGLPPGRSAAEAWADEEAGYPHETLLELAAVHESGLKVASLSTNPLMHPTLKPERVTDAISEARHSFDALVVDMHPSYSDVNQAVFAIADRILVPVTPDLPAMRAAIQLKEVATELGVRDRLAMIINRANSGVTVRDMEETVGMSALAHIRSAGLHFVWSANGGKTLIDRFPRHPVAQDFEHLAERLLTVHAGVPFHERPRESASLLKSLFGRKVVTEG